MNEYQQKRLDHINAGRPRIEKVKKPLRRISDKRAAQIAEEKKMRDNGNTPMDVWFNQRRVELTGKCLFCGGRTEKNNDSTFKRSIAHLLAKKTGMFPSVSMHPDNFLELCFWGNSCHTNFDNGIITWEFLKDSDEWGVIAEKFKKIYPCIAQPEIKNIPSVLLEIIK